MKIIGIGEALLLGFLFGFALQKAGLTHYSRIVGIYRLRDMTVLKFMLTALVVGGVLIQAAVDLGLAAPLPVPPTFVLSNLVGGVVFGIGMATAGYCPGTIVAQAGEGHLDAWTAGLAGVLVGALAFGLVQPLLMPRLARIGALGRVTFASLAGVSPWLVLFLFAEIVALLFYVLARAEAKRSPTAYTTNEMPNPTNQA